MLCGQRSDPHLKKKINFGFSDGQPLGGVLAIDLGLVAILLVMRGVVLLFYLGLGMTP